jgi:hypothetical protein
MTTQRWRWLAFGAQLILLAAAGYAAVTIAVTYRAMFSASLVGAVVVGAAIGGLLYWRRDQALPLRVIDALAAVAILFIQPGLGESGLVQGLLVIGFATALFNALYAQRGIAKQA